MWRGGCIIRSAFLGKIKEAFDKNPNLTNLLLDPFFKKAIKGCQRSLAQGRRHGRQEGHPGAGLQHRAGVLRRLSAANACRPTCSRPSATTSARTPTSALDQPRGQFFHTNWTGHGGRTASSTYNA